MDDRLIDLLRRAEDLKKELDSLRPLDKEREAIVMQKLRLDWNYHSNHLEGNSLTFGETKALILFGITAQGKPLKDHVEITGHDEAIKWIEDVIHKKEPLTEKFIRQLHELLLKEPYEVDAITPDGQPTRKKISIGNYKTTPNHVKTKTGEIFRFATPEETPSQMHDLMEWYRKKSEEKDVNPIILAAEFHYKFIRIHPFDDGNGRMARILMNFILMQYGYPPVIVKTSEKEQYIAALQQADAGIFEPFFEFIINNEIRSLEIMVKGARGENVEDPDDLDKEIALLKQKIKGLGKEVVVERSLEAIRELLDDGLLKLIVAYYTSLQNTFSDLFLKVQFSITVNSDGKRGDNITELIEYVQNAVQNATYVHRIYAEIYFNNLKYIVNGNTNISASAGISIDFTEDTVYRIMNRNSGKLYLQKFYNQNLSKEEIDLIIKNEKEMVFMILKQWTRIV